MNNNISFPKPLNDYFTNSYIKLVSGSTTFSEVKPDTPPYVVAKVNDKHTQKIKLGKLLRQVRKDISNEMIKEYVEQYVAYNTDISQYTIELSRDFVDIYKVPLETANTNSESCMTGSTSVSVYEYDERLFLFLVKFNKEIIGRTLVREDTKEYIRMYLNHNKLRVSVFEEILKQKGYKQGDLNGIELGKENRYSTVCPYLDGDATYLTDFGTYFVITDNEDSADYKGDNVIGRAEPIEKYHCSCCGESFSNIEDMRCTDYDSYCESCFNANYFYYDDDVYSLDDSVIIDSTGERVPRCLLEKDGYIETENGDWDLDGFVVNTPDGYYLVRECRELVIPYEDDYGDVYEYVYKNYAKNISNIPYIKSGIYCLGLINIYIEQITRMINKRVKWRQDKGIFFIDKRLENLVKAREELRNL